MVSTQLGSESEFLTKFQFTSSTICTDYTPVDTKKTTYKYATSALNIISNKDWE